MSVPTREFRRTSDLVLGPTDRPLSKWRRRRKKWRQWRGFVFWAPIIGVLLYGFVIEPMRLTKARDRFTALARGVPRAARDGVFRPAVGPPHITLSRLRGIVEKARELIEGLSNIEC
jgi:hypothetical protein